MNWGLVMVVALATLLLFMGLGYNRFVRVRQHLRESWSGIDVELRRRYDLVPNLVETVRGHAEHERTVLEQVTRARATAVANTGDHTGQIRDEEGLVQALRTLFAVAEGYPELRSDASFRALQEELAETENRLAAIRRLHNANVRRWNTMGQTVPWSLLGGFVNWELEPYFRVTEAVRSSRPRVDTGD